jgi:hypothetical protein
VIEAMGLGAAVLTSNCTSLPEVVRDAGVLVDPSEVEAIYAGMRMLSVRDDLAEELRVRARERASLFFPSVGQPTRCSTFTMGCSLNRSGPKMGVDGKSERMADFGASERS